MWPANIFSFALVLVPKFGHPWPKGREEAKRNLSEDSQCFGLGSKREHSE